MIITFDFVDAVALGLMAICLSVAGLAQVAIWIRDRRGGAKR